MSENEQVEMMAVNMRELRSMWGMGLAAIAKRRQKAQEMVAQGLSADEVVSEMHRRYGVSIRNAELRKMVREYEQQSKPKTAQPTNAEVMAMMQRVLEAIEGRTK